MGRSLSLWRDSPHALWGVNNDAVGARVRVAPTTSAWPIPSMICVAFRGCRGISFSFAFRCIFTILSPMRILRYRLLRFPSREDRDLMVDLVMSWAHYDQLDREIFLAVPAGQMGGGGWEGHSHATINLDLYQNCFVQDLCYPRNP